MLTFAILETVTYGLEYGQKPLERYMRWWEDNIKTDLREMELGVDWIHMAQKWNKLQALVNTVMNLRVL
jgi:hypothetical protein